MKIQCDVCAKEASVFCCADEAALCTPCDRRVHLANKLAGKHCRFSLLFPSSSPSAHPHPHPLCDICQEKQGLIFCQEDRAILCKDCDAAIHTANHLTMKHNRFILTGARLSAAPISPSSPPPEPDEPERSTATIANVISLKTKHSQQSVAATSSNSNISSGSSISEYLIKTLPGWRVEDLLVDDASVAAAAAAANSISSKKNVLLPFMEAELEGNRLDPAAEDFSTVWAPHVPQFPPQCLTTACGGDAAMTHYHSGLGIIIKEIESQNSWSDDGFCTVPEITPSSSNSKRPRPSLWYL